MAAKTIQLPVRTNKSLVEVKSTTKEAIRAVGGIVRDTPCGFEIDGGNLGVNFSFVVQVKSAVTIKQQGPDLYQVECILVWQPNAIFWICLLAGFFFLMFLWIANVLYFFADPVSVYYRHISQVEGMLNPPVGSSLTGGSASNQNDTLEKLKRLQEMLNQKLITPQEYERKKSEILAKM